MFIHIHTLSANFISSEHNFIILLTACDLQLARIFPIANICLLLIEVFSSYFNILWHKLMDGYNLTLLHACTVRVTIFIVVIEYTCILHNCTIELPGPTHLSVK